MKTEDLTKKINFYYYTSQGTERWKWNDIPESLLDKRDIFSVE